MEASGRWVTEKQEVSVIGTPCYQMTFLVVGVVESRDVFMHYERIYLIVPRMLGQTQKWGLYVFLGG